MLLNNSINYEMNIVIVKMGLGSKVISIAKECGISGGTVLLGRGSIKNALLEFLEIANSKKEIVWVINPVELGNRFLTQIYKKLKFDKPNTGICFSIPLISTLGMSSKYHDTDQSIHKDEREGDYMTTYNSVIVIVDKGNAEKVIDAAVSAGARGGTIINGRGSGIHETSKLFGVEIEPEKEIILILIDHEIVENIANAIQNSIKINEPGNGILFVQPVNRVYGIF